MTISKTALYGQEQAPQDMYSNIDLIQRFIAKTKARLLQDSVSWQRVRKGAKKDLIDVLLAENAAASINALVGAELNGGYQYVPLDEVDEDEAANEPPTFDEVFPKRRGRLSRRARA